MPNQFHDPASPSPWLVGLLPWVIDLLFKTSYLNTFWGALLWGFLLVVYFAQARLIDPTLKRYLNYLLLGVGVLWILGWLRSFANPVVNPLKPADSLYFLHATFLVAATGMLFVVLAASAAGVLKQKRIFAPTVPARGPSRKSPSLEGLLKLCSWSFGLVKIFWLLGCVLAILALAVHSAHNVEGWREGFARWLHDPAMWAVWCLAALFIGADAYLHTDLQIKKRFRGYCALAVFSLAVASAVICAESRRAGHMNGEFLR